MCSPLVMSVLMSDQFDDDDFATVVEVSPGVGGCLPSV